MQFRFLEYNEETNTNKLLGYTDIEDYDAAFRMFTYMKEHKCSVCVMINTEDLVDTEGEYYRVNNICFVTEKIGGDIRPHICVTLEEDYF